MGMQPKAAGGPAPAGAAHAPLADQLAFLIPPSCKAICFKGHASSGRGRRLIGAGNAPAGVCCPDPVCIAFFAPSRCCNRSDMYRSCALCFFLEKNNKHRRPQKSPANPPKQYIMRVIQAALRWVESFKTRHQQSQAYPTPRG